MRYTIQQAGSLVFLTNKNNKITEGGFNCKVDGFEEIEELWQEQKITPLHALELLEKLLSFSIPFYPEDEAQDDLGFEEAVREFKLDLFSDISATTVTPVLHVCQCCRRSAWIFYPGSCTPKYHSKIEGRMIVAGL